MDYIIYSLNLVFVNVFSYLFVNAVTYCKYIVDKDVQIFFIKRLVFKKKILIYSNRGSKM